MKKMLFALALLVGATFPLLSAGFIVIEDPSHWPAPMPEIWPPPRPVPPPRYFPPPRRWAPLEVTEVQANVMIKDQVANTKIDQEFYNPNNQRLEGTFLLPIPKGAHIDRFAMEVDSKQVHAELLAAEKARDIYENIVRQAKDPALLEYTDRDVFKVRIFPIEPHSKKRVSLSWVQVLKADSGLVPYVFPLNTEKFSAKPVRNVSLKLDLETRRPLKSIYSPSHKVEIKRHGNHKATIGYESADAHPDSDFQLLFSEEEGEFGASLLTHKRSDEDGYFLLLVSPSAELKAERVMAKDVIFVLDSSGSMAGAKLEQAKKALLFCVANLNDKDRFEVIRFSTEVEIVFDKLVDATTDNRSRAERFINEVKPTGGTAIDDALSKALGSRGGRPPEGGTPSGSSDRPYIIVFLTDGRPTMGVTDEGEILKNVKKRNEENTRIFVFGIGTDVNTHLLDKIAEQTKAFSQYVLPEEDIEVKVSNFFAKIKEPVLANPKLILPDEVRASKIYPSPLPDLFKGEQLIVAGRYTGRGSGKLRIEGTVNGQRREFDYEVKFPGEDSDYEFIPRLWATRRVGYLLDEIRLHGDNKELRDEVTGLARKYGIVTPYTSYLIVEDERQRGVTNAFRTLRLEEREDARRDLSFYYESFSREKSGDLGVAASQSAEFLKRAEAPAVAAAGADIAARRPATLAQSSPAGPRSLASEPQLGLRVQNAPARTAKEISSETRFAGGRAFYRNGDIWVDAYLQRTNQSQPVRLNFGSAEYFALLRKNPEVRDWLALGPNVQFVLDGRVYEVRMQN